MTDYRDTQEAGGVRTPRGTRVSPEDTTSQTWLAEGTSREAITQDLMELGQYLAANPATAKRRLKPIRSSKELDPGVYFNLGTGMVDRVFRPQHVALGHKMFRVSSDPAAPVAEIRRKILGGN
ncbi:MAG: hypothetical protein AVDCRST_MAG12-2517 [uncultured Rubrobacteraceae bacterium]|uniref:Uncharacterized protein n=1 Tax=uncultured Rubrobacteraceae bacterium TaxID=349277 RepID=A0A6J4SHL5_9ACTN|nr:MAG: hypothetical protein AVDCRST_MAG12-2517 [uncultured Rubrobacteraceae bacterium]